MIGGLCGIENTFGHGENGIRPFAFMFAVFGGVPLAGLFCLDVIAQFLSRGSRGRQSDGERRGVSAT